MAFEIEEGLVQAIVEDHHGAVQVTSKVGRGTKFRVMFPVASRVVPI